MCILSTEPRNATVWAANQIWAGARAAGKAHPKIRFLVPAAIVDATLAAADAKPWQVGGARCAGWFGKHV